jgi:hypothetical protein
MPNDPCDVFACPVCKAEYDEFTPEYGLVFDELMRRAGLRDDDRITVAKLADRLEAEYAAKTGRDFGRGFMHAVTLLRSYRP